MSSFIFNQVKGMAIQGQLDFSTQAFKLALLDNVIVDDPETWSEKTLWSEVESNQIIPGGGYTIPVDLANVVVAEINDVSGDSLKDFKVSADNVTWVQSTITASCAVIYREDGKLICALDLRPDGSTPVSSVVGTFTVTLDTGSGGFLIIN